jgi:hypothetical protein
MFLFEQEADLTQDREDLIAVLRMRFGLLEPGLIEEIYRLNDLDTIERLILVAANAPTLKVFLRELEEGKEGFRIVGEEFNPIGWISSGGDNDGRKEQ